MRCTVCRCAVRSLPDLYLGDLGLLLDKRILKLTDLVRHIVGSCKRSKHTALSSSLSLTDLLDHNPTGIVSHSARSWARGAFDQCDQ
jgi:hypothetical protein